MAIRVYNTLTRTKEDFVPVRDGRVRMYVCGPTVYAPSHIGHAVGPVIFDCIKRYLTFRNYQVTWVLNVTDVEDKLINRAREEGTTVEALAKKHAADYFEDLKRLNVTGIDVVQWAAPASWRLSNGFWSAPSSRAARGGNGRRYRNRYGVPRIVCSLPLGYGADRTSPTGGGRIMKKGGDVFGVRRLLKPLVCQQNAPHRECEGKSAIPWVGPKGGRVPRELEAAVQQARRRGKPLDGALEEKMSACLGRDFSDVRVHTGPEADELSRCLCAKAFTIGSDVFFARGAYAPQTRLGRHLIAHELVHVAQQHSSSGCAPPSGMFVGTASDAMEQEAERLASLATAEASWQEQKRSPVRLRTRLRATIQRALGLTCGTGVPGEVGQSCHACTMWWIFSEWNERRGTDPGVGQFTARVPQPNETIASLVKKYGRRRTLRWTRGQISIARGSVVVFAKSTADMQSGHSCICDNAGHLRGRTQGNFFVGPGNAQGFSDPLVGNIKWTSETKVNGDFNVYTIEEDKVMRWAGREWG